MPLSELVLDVDHGPDVRLTDRPVAVGDTFRVEATYWEVVCELARVDGDRARFQCRRAPVNGKGDAALRTPAHE
jgi:hypothetical protein